MFGMTQDQLMGFLRQVIPGIGGVLVAIGWFTSDQVAAGTQLVMQILGPLLTIVGVIWAAIANSKSSILQSAAQMPEVKEIKVDKASSLSELPAAEIKPS